MLDEYLRVHPLQWQQMAEALEAAKPYVETCAEPDGGDAASVALAKINDALLLRPNR